MAVKKSKKTVWISSLGTEYDDAQSAYKAEAVDLIKILFDRTCGDRVLEIVELAEVIVENRAEIEQALGLLDKKD